MFDFEIFRAYNATRTPVGAPDWSPKTPGAAGRPATCRTLCTSRCGPPPMQERNVPHRTPPLSSSSGKGAQGVISTAQSRPSGEEVKTSPRCTSPPVSSYQPYGFTQCSVIHWRMTSIFLRYIFIYYLINVRNSTALCTSPKPRRQSTAEGRAQSAFTPRSWRKGLER